MCTDFRWFNFCEYCLPRKISPQRKFLRLQHTLIMLLLVSCHTQDVAELINSELPHSPLPSDDMDSPHSVCPTMKLNLQTGMTFIHYRMCTLTCNQYYRPCWVGTDQWFTSCILPVFFQCGALSLLYYMLRI